MPVLPNSGPSGVEEEFGNSDLTHAGEQLEKPWVWLPTSTDEVLADLRDTGSYLDSWTFSPKDSVLPGHSPRTHFKGILRDFEEWPDWEPGFYISFQPRA